MTKVLATALHEYKDAKLRVIELTKNLEFAPYEVGKKIGQMVVIPYPDVDIKLVETLSETSRGEDGFGSTDKNKA